MTDSFYKNKYSFQVEFPPWLEAILPVQIAVNYINKQLSGDDCIDDILNTALKRISDARSQNKPINEGYVFATLRNLVIDRIRKLKREANNKEKEITRTIKSVNSIIKDLDVLEIINRKIKTLDLRKRVIIKLRCHTSHKFTFKEIGDILGYSASTARMEFKSACDIIEASINKSTI